jgi:hypothetical protein
MQIKTLERQGAVAAIIGGALRIANNFLPALHVSGSVLDEAYFVTDVFLLLGIFALFARNATRVGWLGLAGFLLFFVGILLVRSPQVGFLLGGYQAVAGIALVGINLFGVAMMLAHLSRLAPLLWLGSLVVGLAAGFGEAQLALLASGTLFGLGFVAAGVRELRN